MFENLQEDVLLCYSPFSAILEVIELCPLAIKGTQLFADMFLS